LPPGDALPKSLFDVEQPTSAANDTDATVDEMDCFMLLSSQRLSESLREGASSVPDGMDEPTFEIFEG
jgi:hypothetical protein